VALAILAMAGPAWGTAEPGGDTEAPPGTAVELRADGTLSVRIEETVPLADLVRAIGALIGAEVIVRHDPGTIDDPTNVEELPPDELLLRLAGRHSLALRYRAGRIVAIILVASREDAPQPEQPSVQSGTPADELNLPEEPASEGDAQNRRAVTIRDIARLSYQQDAAAAAELEHLYLTNDDPEVRGAAIAALAGSQSGDAVPLINHALYDPEPHVRLRAAQGLWVARGPDATPRLQQIARSDRAAEVRAGVARLLDGDAEVGPQPRASLHPQAVDR
jgi:hypothetical protein